MLKLKIKFLQNSISLNKKFIDKVHKKFANVTFRKVASVVKRNAHYNLKYSDRGKSIAELRNFNYSSKNAIIVAPSNKRIIEQINSKEKNKPNN